VCAQSESQAGKQVTETHTDLSGETNLTFEMELNFDELDVLFMCKGHGESKVYHQQTNIPSQVKIIDLSNDFRSKADADGFVYGLPEVFRSETQNTSKVANPGCFATCIQVGLLPAAKARVIQSEVHTSAITGSTGAGQKLSPTSHFSWRNNNMSVYKALTHQHLGEIGETLETLAGEMIE
jgi:N-acetyl-gamma-glutamyl-phosphate reductase